MKTKQVLEQVELMNDSLINELNSIVADMRNKPNKSDVQTIAKHVQELEEKVDKLENYIYAQDEKEWHNIDWQPIPHTIQFFTIEEKDGKYSVGKKVYPEEKPKIANPDIKEVCYPFANNSFDALRKAVYVASTNSLINFCKSKIGIPERETVQFNGEPLEVTEMQKEVLRTLFVDKVVCKPDYFLKAKNLLIEYAEKTMIRKGIEYTPVGDRFANFRPILGEKKTALEKLIGYNAKHVQYCFMQETNMTAKTIDELLEHWGDVFNYNVLGLAMQNTDKPNSVVPYADRATQEKEIKDIVNGVKNFTEYNSKLTNNELYSRLLGCIKESNLNYIIYLFAKQLERLENQK